MSDKYGAGQDAQYCYPNSDVLINKLGITEADALEVAGIALTQARIDHFEPNFDHISLPALRSIHFHMNVRPGTNFPNFLVNVRPSINFFAPQVLEGVEVAPAPYQPRLQA